MMLGWLGRQMSAKSQAFPESHEKGKFLLAGRWAGWLFALLLAGAVVVAALHWGDVEKFTQLAAQSKPVWLAAALLLQLLTYAGLSGQWWLVLRCGKTPLRFQSLLPITISKLFADQVVPTSGMSGNVLLVDRLMARDIPRRNAVAAAILAIFAYYASFAACALAAAILLWLQGDISWLLIAAVSIFLLLAAAIPAAILWLQDKGRSAVPRWLARFRPVRELFDMIGEAPDKLVRNPRLIGQMSLLNGGVWIADALTLQVCLLALGQPAAFDAAFVGLVIASIIATIGPVPLGLGSFEASSIAMLRLMGVPFEAALSATLLYRGFTLWLPLLAGLALSRRELKRGRN